MESGRNCLPLPEENPTPGLYNDNYFQFGSIDTVEYCAMEKDTIQPEGSCFVCY